MFERRLSHFVSLKSVLDFLLMENRVEMDTTVQNAVDEFPVALYSSFHETHYTS